MIKLFLGVVLLLVVGLAGVYVAENRGLVQAGTFVNLTSKFSAITKHLPTEVATEGVENGVKVLSSQASNISPEAGAVLGSSITVEKQEAPLTQRAFEFARYNYCQAVVNDYQARYQPAVSPQP